MRVVEGWGLAADMMQGECVCRISYAYAAYASDVESRYIGYSGLYGFACFAEKPKSTETET